MRIVCDTNVLLSATAFSRNSPPAKVIEIVRTGSAELFLSPFILDELSKNLREKADWEDVRIFALLKNLRTLATIIQPRTKIKLIHEKESDNRILECAVEAKAQALVTGNFKHIRPLGSFQGIEILTPREFIQKYFTYF